MGNRSTADPDRLLAGRGPGAGAAVGLAGPGAAALVGGVLLIGAVLAGNSLVCVSVATERALQTPTNSFIVSLAAADLLLALLVLPLFVYSEVQGGAWLLSPRLCDALMAMDVMLCTASIFNLCAISVDRFVAVAVPLRYNRQGGSRRQLLLIGATWLLSAAVAAPVLCGLNDVRGRDPAVCRLEDRDYVVYSSVCSFFLPCPLMLLLYWATFRGLRRWEVARRAKLHGRAPRRPSGPGPPSLAPRLPQDPCGPDCAPPAPGLPQGPCGPDCAPPAPGLPQDPCGPDCAPPAPRLPQDPCDSNCAPPDAVRAAALPPQTPPQTRRRRRAKITGRERKAMRVLPVVVGAFLLCWTPFFVVHITQALCPACSVPPRLVSAVTWLGYVNSALNPVIYTVFNAEFRSVFRKALRACC
ncbi:D(4) dopamine receptor isoform X2 [Rhinopithecus roxellana]|uniref:D(4) dopamine receptor isoform X2 n=1 Tax=Rhinopithecus roxellana TaxID=61622 RepID=UPI0012374355|nr:D(4) dopamine receptor isoform X2 [Rhinopithecus roxellana]